MVRKKKYTLSTTQIILLSFLLTILVGSALLALPISSATGDAVPYLDALFTATTSTCVTGLVTLPTVSAWSVFGQIVILLLIQIGGLGIITIMSGLMLLLNRKMGIGDRLLIQDAFNLNTMSGLAQFVKNVLLGTLIIDYPVKPYYFICLLCVIYLERPDGLVVLLNLEHGLLGVVAHPDTYASYSEEVEDVRKQPVDPEPRQEISSSQGDEELLEGMSDLLPVYLESESHPVIPFPLFLVLRFVLLCLPRFRFPEAVSAFCLPP